MRVLVVDDEPKLAALVARALREEGHAADLASNGTDALWMAQAAPYDAIVLDVMLPGIDGFEVLRGLREREVWTPVLMLTARDAVIDRVDGLDAGADDYLTKPFSFDELLARLRAIARRGAIELRLTAREFTILELFMRRPGQVLTRLQLLEGAWDMAFESRSNIVDVYMRYLREKIDRPFGRASLETVRGVGYRLREDGGVAA